MSYQALARKWRPQDFSSIIGQEPIVAALQNALRDGRIAQAYLFSGIRGVGKTTAARVLAKALNCEFRTDGNPCNDCGSCREITAGSDLDVLEIDAATYSKVDQVRDLAESLQYGPASRRYKVVVLDEVHRLSRQAFDALLKIVEEPPPHLVFVFATTEKEAVPATILSRCQEFNFRRVDAALLARHLEVLCGAESIEASERALRWIARAGEGSVRDAVALLDQLATYGGGRITEADAQGLLGGVRPELFAAALSAILAGDAARLRQQVQEIEDEGWDPALLFGRFLTYVRDGLHLGLNPDDERVDLSSEDTAQLAELCRDAGYENLLRLLHHLLSSELLVRQSEHPALALELAWLRAAELPKLIRVEEILAGNPLPREATRAPRPTPARKQPAETKPSPSRKEPEPGPPPPLDEPPVPSENISPPPPEAFEPAPSPAPPSDPRRVVREVIEQRSPLLAAQFEPARFRVDGESLVITPPPGDHLLLESLERPKCQDVLEDALSQARLESYRLETTSEETTEGDPAEAMETDALPGVQAVLDIFDGRIETVRTRSPQEEESS